MVKNNKEITILLYIIISLSFLFLVYNCCKHNIKEEFMGIGEKDNSILSNVTNEIDKAIKYDSGKLQPPLLPSSPSSSSSPSSQQYSSNTKITNTNELNMLISSLWSNPNNSSILPFNPENIGNKVLNPDPNIDAIKNKLNISNNNSMLLNYINNEKEVLRLIGISSLINDNISISSDIYKNKMFLLDDLKSYINDSNIKNTTKGFFQLF